MDFKDLQVWQKAHQLALEVYQVTKESPSEEKYRLTDQLCRSAASIPANIAEGKGRNSQKEFLRFLTMARGSVEETKYHLLLAHDLDYMSDDTFTDLNNGYNDVGKMLNGLINKVRKEVRTSS